MAASKKKVVKVKKGAKKAKASKPAPKPKAKPVTKPAAKAAAKVVAKAVAKSSAKPAAKPVAKPAAKPPANQVAAAKKAAAEAAAKAKAAERAAQAAEAHGKKELARVQRELDQMTMALEKERQKLAAAQGAIGEQKDAAKQAELAKKQLEKDVEREKREAIKRAEAEKKAAEKAEALRIKQEAKAAEDAAKVAAKIASKKKVVPMSSLAAAPIFRPLTDARADLAPLPPQSKPGHVDHQILSAIEYGLFAAVNKTFGFAGQSVVKNASLRILEYGYKRQWLPPKSKEPVRALNEFFNRLEVMGYADKIHVAKRGESFMLEVQGLADFEAVHELRGMHYPLLPVFLGAMLEAIVDQYFQLKVTMETIEWVENKRGFNMPFSMHERTIMPEVSRLPAMSRTDDYED